MAKELILLVDNDLDILEVLKRRLISKEFRVETALSGEAALELVKNHKPDLAILDLKLPGMDGYELCRRLKKDRRYRDIPVIMLTVKDQAEDKLQGIEAGVDVYLTKPYVSDRLLREIERQLLLVRMRHGRR
jgi:DNA-binding response OmpR family regulator